MPCLVPSLDKNKTIIQKLSVNVSLRERTLMTIGHINTKHSAQSTPTISRSTTTVSVHLLNTKPLSAHRGSALVYCNFSSCSSLHRRSLSWLPSTDKLHLHFVSSIKEPVKAQSQCLPSPHSLKRMNQKVCQQAAGIRQEALNTPLNTHVTFPSFL